MTKPPAGMEFRYNDLIFSVICSLNKVQLLWLCVIIFLYNILTSQPVTFLLFIQTQIAERLTLIVVNTLRSVPLVVLGPRVVGAVHWDLQVVAAESVSVCVGIGEQTTLERTIWKTSQHYYTHNFSLSYEKPIRTCKCYLIKYII